MWKFLCDVRALINKCLSFFWQTKTFNISICAHSEVTHGKLSCSLISNDWWTNYQSWSICYQEIGLQTSIEEILLRRYIPYLFVNCIGWKSREIRPNQKNYDASEEETILMMNEVSCMEMQGNYVSSLNIRFP